MFQACSQTGEGQADLFPGPSLFRALYLGPSAGLPGKEGNPKTSVNASWHLSSCLHTAANKPGFWHLKLPVALFDGLPPQRQGGATFVLEKGHRRGESGSEDRGTPPSLTQGMRESR